MSPLLPSKMLPNRTKDETGKIFNCVQINFEFLLSMPESIPSMCVKASQMLGPLPPSLQPPSTYNYTTNLSWLELDMKLTPHMQMWTTGIFQSVPETYCELLSSIPRKHIIKWYDQLSREIYFMISAWPIPQIGQ